MIGLRLRILIREGESICYEQEFDLAPLFSFCFALAWAYLKTNPSSVFKKGTMPSLAISFSDWNVHDPNPEKGRRSDFIMRGCHIVTPSTRGKTHYFLGAPLFDVPKISKEVADKTKASCSSQHLTKIKISFKNFRKMLIMIHVDWIIWK